uniref:C3H1-type domain-containing protein n=1 Tax=Eutreptiella gymnastica TaxID=73025 RepID=A0A7S1I5Z2_9EUGL
MTTEDSKKRELEDGSTDVEAKRQKCWWSLAKSELYNLREVVRRLNHVSVSQIPEGMFAAANLNEEYCRSQPDLHVKKMVEKKISLVAADLAQSHPCLTQSPGCPNPSACNFKDVPSYTCMWFLLGECAKDASDCPYEHLYPNGKYLVSRLRPGGSKFKSSMGRQAGQVAAATIVTMDAPGNQYGSRASAASAPAGDVPRPRGAYTSLPPPVADEPPAYQHRAPPAYNASRVASNSPQKKEAPLPLGLKCTVVVWKTNYQEFLENLKLDLLDNIMQLGEG